MADFVFTSPGIKFRERDLSFVTRNVGITNLGLVGETIKGPAFEPVFIEDQGQFKNKFGGQTIKRFPSGKLQYELPYVANAYLEESSQLYVTRVLGLSGYDAGTAWAITLDAGVDPSTTGETSTVVTGSALFTNNVYLGTSLYATGDTGSYFSGFTKVSSTSFSGNLVEFTATTYSASTGGGTVATKTTTLSGTSYSNYENMVVAVIRSRGYVQDNINLAPETVFNASTLTISGNTTVVGSGNLFGQFTLNASKPADSEDVPESYVVNLNPNSSSFISNVLGITPKDKNNKIWVEAVYPDLIKKLDADGFGYGINTTMIEATTDIFTNYRTQFKTPESPWVVSQLMGNEISRLFKFISISDGNSANQEIKTSIANIKPETLEFDVIIRDFNDTDANPIVLETFTRCTMVKGLTNYVGQRIGTSDGEYDLLSNYVMIEIADNIPDGSFPAGFEGYMFNNYSTSNTGAGVTGVEPKIFYKTSYLDSENINKTYLGISPAGYSGTGLTGSGINQNMFNFNGYKNGGSNTASGYTKTKGFHMDSGATGTYFTDTQFEVGEGQFRTVSDINSSTDTYYNIKTRKFTFNFSGGFDGWDVHRNSRSYVDGFQINGIWDGVAANVTPKNDFQAWQTAINTFSNPEEVTINLFATPGLNWSDNNILVQETIDMIENERTDTLYIIDSPDVTISTEIGQGKPDILASNEIVDLIDLANLDSSYATTYFPYIQIRDTQNNANVYIPPTGEVVKAMAFTDNTSFPWFAPAGLNRGVTDARKSKYKLSLDARDILYNGRINPIADFAESGTAIFGQKTLQVRESALDRINVRRLLLQIKVLISNIATRLIFEQNDQATVDQFLSKANPVLDTIKRERGLQEFKITMDDTNNTPETRDRNELYGEIFLKPTRTLEYLGITFTITPSGASFDEAGA
jgi:hypothetical protein